MAIPQNKDELQCAISTSFEKLQKTLAIIPIENVKQKTMKGHAQGTMMSPCDLVAYLIGWNELVLKWLEIDDAGGVPDFPETGYKWSELGHLAQKFYSHYDQLDFKAQCARLSQVNQQILENTSKRSNEELYEIQWYRQWTKGRMIQLNTSSPYENARIRLRKWLKENK